MDLEPSKIGNSDGNVKVKVKSSQDNLIIKLS